MTEIHPISVVRITTPVPAFFVRKGNGLAAKALSAAFPCSVAQSFTVSM
jgi:hypothetical protein